MERNKINKIANDININCKLIYSLTIKKHCFNDKLIHKIYYHDVDALLICN